MSKNGYGEYALDLQKRKGIKSSSEAFAMAGEPWAKLDSEEKAKWKKRAREGRQISKNSQQNYRAGRSKGAVRTAARMKQEKQRLEDLERAKRFYGPGDGMAWISKRKRDLEVLAFGFPDSTKPGEMKDHLRNQTFSISAMLPFCGIESELDCDTIPGEFATMKFTFEEGPKSVSNWLIRPDTITEKFDFTREEGGVYVDFSERALRLEKGKTLKEIFNELRANTDKFQFLLSADYNSFNAAWYWLKMQAKGLPIDADHRDSRAFVCLEDLVTAIHWVMLKNQGKQAQRGRLEEIMKEKLHWYDLHPMTTCPCHLSMREPNCVLRRLWLMYIALYESVEEVLSLEPSPRYFPQPKVQMQVGLNNTETDTLMDSGSSGSSCCNDERILEGLSECTVSSKSSTVATEQRKRPGNVNLPSFEEYREKMPRFKLDQGSGASRIF